MLLHNVLTGYFVETKFEVSVNLTDYQWNDDYHNTSSDAYAELVAALITEVTISYISLTQNVFLRQVY